jgi:hypothetical protein
VVDVNEVEVRYEQADQRNRQDRRSSMAITPLQGTMSFSSVASVVSTNTLTAPHHPVVMSDKTPIVVSTTKINKSQFQIEKHRDNEIRRTPVIRDVIHHIRGRHSPAERRATAAWTVGSAAHGLFGFLAIPRSARTVNLGPCSVVVPASEPLLDGMIGAHGKEISDSTVRAKSSARGATTLENAS